LENINRELFPFIENNKNDPNNSNEEKKKDIEISYPKLSYKDFELLKLLGIGSIGHILLVRFISNNQLYAMKILSKNQLKITHQEEHTKTERDLMVKLNSPFLVNIKFAFQDETKLYIVSDFMQGGDMFYHLHSQNKFPENKAKFYLIEIILGLEALHKNNMIYRDLKPENILMDSEGHIKLTDFGLSKILDESNNKAFTLCGIQQYLVPEVLKNTGYDKSVDFWFLDCFF
jgi:serine/threonine protein kinase